jgi:hypothetical protein
MKKHVFPILIMMILLTTACGLSSIECIAGDEEMS